MKKIILLILMISFAVTGYAKKNPEELNKRTEFYYKLGCKALKHKDMEKAEECFLEATKTIFKTTVSWSVLTRDSYPNLANYDIGKIAEGRRHDLAYDVENIKNLPNDNFWKVFYYKGFSEINLLHYNCIDFMHESDVPGVDKDTLLRIYNSTKDCEKLKSLIINSLNQAISLYDNYQSHMLLCIYLGSNVESGDEERKKAIDAALLRNDKYIAKKIEKNLVHYLYIAGKNEEALYHLKRIQEYEPDEEIEKEIMELNEKVEFEKAKKKAYYEERKKYKSWNNLYNYLATGNVGLYGPYEKRYIPFEEGDIVEAQLMQLEAIDVDIVPGGYAYLVSSCGYSNFSKCCYIISKKQLVFGMAAMVGEKLKRIQCIGTAQYKSGYSIVDTYVFNVIE